jgi:hypothetical protein
MISLLDKRKGVSFKPMKVNTLLFQRQQEREVKTTRPPTPQQLQHFKENRERVIQKPLYAQLKRTGDVFHGAKSRNEIITHTVGKKKAEKYDLLKDSYDYDVYTDEPEIRAEEIKNKINKKYKSEMSNIEGRVIGKKPPTFVKPEKIEHDVEKRHERWVVRTPVTPKDKVEVDYATYPDRKIKTKKIKGVNHESIETTLERHYILVHQPLRTHRTWEDIRRLKRFIKVDATSRRE